MGIKCTTYGGRVGWFLRKHFSFVTSDAYLNFQYYIRENLFLKYMDFFDKNPQQPCLISIETINRCNSTCAFCPANRNEDKRPFAKMEEALFYKIINDLKEMDYHGYLNLYVNNEPFMDMRIEDWYKYAKQELPNVKMLLYTNGLLLSKERFEKIIPYIDKMIINNYSDGLKLHKNVESIYELVKSRKEYHNKDITIQIRYINEILTNRAGEAPNKRKKREGHRACIMPYTDITIYPDGTIGLCCSDAREKTNYGNIRDISVSQLWNGEVYKELRKVIGRDRSKYAFCKGCDFVDAGIRNTFMECNMKNSR